MEKIEYLSNTIRIEHVINDNHRIFGRASWYNRDSNYNHYYRNIATGEWFLFKSRQGTFDHVWTISPTMVLNSRYGYNRFIRGTNSNSGNRSFDLTSLGFPSYYNSLIPEDIRRFPRFNINGYQGTAVGGELRPTDTHSFTATMNQTLNTHSIKYGVEFRSYRETDKFFGNNQTGTFDFGANWTRGPLDKLTDKTVIRGGYGIFYGFLGQRRGDVNQIGFSATVPLNVTLNNGLTFVETLNNPFETYKNGLPAPLGASEGARTFLGQGISFFNPRPLSPYNQR